MQQLGNSVLMPNSRYGAFTVVGGSQPDKHLATIVFGQSLPGPASEAAVGMVFGSPVGASKCDGAAVYILPTSKSCVDVQKSVQANKGELAASLANVIPVIDNPAGANKLLLIPSASGSCVVVAFQTVDAP